jgi:hypothetical protein
MEDTNELIAEFMGYKVMKENDFLNYNYPKNTNLDNIMIDVAITYHKSWDWLMPVVEEIDHLQFEEVVEIETGLKMRSLSATYNAVVEFIKQQNKNK